MTPALYHYTTQHVLRACGLNKHNNYWWHCYFRGLHAHRFYVYKLYFLYPGFCKHPYYLHSEKYWNFTCDMEHWQKSQSKSAHFQHFFFLATLLNFGQALPVLPLKHSIIPCIEGRALVPPQSFIHQVLSGVISCIKEKANFTCSSIVSILDQFL